MTSKPKMPEEPLMVCIARNTAFTASLSRGDSFHAEMLLGRFFTEAGFVVEAITGLRCPMAMDIARVPDERLREVVAELDSMIEGAR